MRVDKFLAHNGFGSRKEVKQLIKERVVYLNDEVVMTPKTLVDINNDVVRVYDEIIEYKAEVYYMLNKPAGYICSHDNMLYPSVLDLVDDLRPDLIIVGRLDVDTEGLLLITSDGKFAHQVSHGKNDVYKQYYVELVDEFDQSCINKLQSGIILDDVLLKPAQVEMIDEKSLLLSISEGRYHQVKRMMHYCNNEVLYLRREKIGNLTLDPDLELGEYRELSANELKKLI